jgi:hypothetical protein
VALNQHRITCSSTEVLMFRVASVKEIISEIEGTEFVNGMGIYVTEVSMT